MFIVNFFVGLLIVGAGVLMIVKNYQLTNLFGRNNIFERKLGSGSTFMMMKLLGLFVVFLGFLMTFSLHDNFFEWIMSPFVGAFS